MFKPELYHETNRITAIQAVEALDKYSIKMKWSRSDNVIDLGSGDGKITSILFEKIPQKKSILGCDISKKMVDFANEKYGNDNITFKLFDLGGELLPELKEAFDHAFSFYTIQWIGNQKNVFSNIYDMLKDGGDCLLMFPAQTPIYEFYRILAQQPRWSHYLRHANDYISPYQDCQNPEDQVSELMSSIGFRDIEVKRMRKPYHSDLGQFRVFVESLSPFEIPSHLEQQYMEDYMAVVEDLKYIHLQDGDKVINMEYTLIVVFGRK